MKFFIDTASVEEIREAASYGLLDGVTTNPTLLSREDASPSRRQVALGADQLGSMMLTDGSEEGSESLEDESERPEFELKRV